MDLLIADNHFGKHPARIIRQELADGHGIDFRFFEDDLTSFLDISPGSVDLLALHLIGDTSGIAHAGIEVEKWVQEYLRPGKPLLLLHGSSAAFSKWAWWRRMVGFRWVRKEDPDGLAPSTHPIVPARMARTKTVHPLAARLRDFDMPEDELYINLAYEGPTWVLMEASYEGRSFPMCYECRSSHGGTIVGWLPGHREPTLRHPDFLHNTAEIVRYLKG